MDKVSVIVDPALAEGDLAERHPECASLAIETHEGQSLSGFLGEPTGMPGKPLSDAALADKFNRCSAFAGLPEAAGATLLELVQTIERQESLSGLFQAFACLASQEAVD